MFNTCKQTSHETKRQIKRKQRKEQIERGRERGGKRETANSFDFAVVLSRLRLRFSKDSYGWPCNGNCAPAAAMWTDRFTGWDCAFTAFLFMCVRLCVYLRCFTLFLDVYVCVGVHLIQPLCLFSGIYLTSRHVQVENKEPSHRYKSFCCILRFVTGSWHRLTQTDTHLHTRTHTPTHIRSLIQHLLIHRLFPQHRIKRYMLQ